MNILLLETATAVCSVALAQGETVVAERRSDAPNAHSSKLSVFIGEILAEGGMKPSELDAVCVSSGPGSYTGLRIGVSSAKGFCYALGLPLLSVPTLRGMATHFFALHPDCRGLVCPMIDARRMECYTAIYSSSLEELKPVGADVVEERLYDRWLDSGTVTFIGDGAEKTRQLLGGHPNARYSSDFAISAAGLLPAALGKLAAGECEDSAYFEPFYLKDFVAKKSVVRGLR